MATRRRFVLPSQVEGIAGPIKVVIVVGPRDHDDVTHDPVKDPCHGTYSASKRQIELDPSIVEAHRIHTYFHELAHAALMDSGVSHLLSDRVEEAVCDAIATARVRERFG